MGHTAESVNKMPMVFECKDAEFDNSARGLSNLNCEFFRTGTILNISDDMQCPLEIPRGDLNATCGRNLGEVCSYTCDEGMIAFNTSMKITCGSNATWDITLESICTGMVYY